MSTMDTTDSEDSPRPSVQGLPASSSGQPSQLTVVGGSYSNMSPMIIMNNVLLKQVHGRCPAPLFCSRRLTVWTDKRGPARKRYPPVLFWVFALESFTPRMCCCSHLKRWPLTSDIAESICWPAAILQQEKPEVNCASFTSYKAFIYFGDYLRGILTTVEARKCQKAKWLLNYLYIICCLLISDSPERWRGGRNPIRMEYFYWWRWGLWCICVYGGCTWP